MTHAEIMKDFRRRHGLTQTQAAERLGYGAQSRISEIESGKEKMSKSVLKLIEALDKRK